MREFTLLIYFFAQNYLSVAISIIESGWLVVDFIKKYCKLVIILDVEISVPK